MKFRKKLFWQRSKKMELKFKGQFNRDIDIDNRKVLEQVRDCILQVKKARSIAQIPNIKKLRLYKTRYRIRVARNYRIGLIIRNKVVWFVRFGHRSSFYDKFP